MTRRPVKKTTTKKTTTKKAAPAPADVETSTPPPTPDTPTSETPDPVGDEDAATNTPNATAPESARPDEAVYDGTDIAEHTEYIYEDIPGGGRRITRTITRRVRVNEDIETTTTEFFPPSWYTAPASTHPTTVG